MIKLDKKDKKILYELDKNSRQPISKIAKATRLSNETVNYRIRQLEKKRLIEGYYAVINISKLGYIYYRIFLKFQNITEQTKQQIIDYAKSSSYIGWIVNIDGEWDLALVVWAKNTIEFKKMYDDISYKFGNYIQKKNFSIATDIYHFQHKYLFNEKNYEEAFLGGNIENIEIDNFDIKILKLLAENARLNILEISKKINLSPNAVKYRINKLIEKKIITGFKVKLNLKLIGYTHYKIFLRFQKKDKMLENKLLNFLRYHPNIIYVTIPIGEDDLEFELMANSQEEFHKIVNNIRYEFSDLIRDYKYYVVYSEPQINYLPMKRS